MGKVELVNEIDGLVDSNELAKRFGVSRLTTINWRKKGCPHKRIEVRNSLGNTDYRIYFDLDEVGEWEEDYRDSIVTGPIVRKKGAVP